MILSAQSIRDRCRLRFPLLPVPDGWRPMLQPFVERTVHEASGTTYGLGPCTYDVRVREAVTMRPGDFKLCSTIEEFCMPLDVCATVMDKSSLVRLGLTVQNTHLDPGWRGYLTLELANIGHGEIRLAPCQPIAQIKFEMLDHVTELPYRGKYQNQDATAVPSRREPLASVASADNT